MILTCPSCETRFQIPDGALGEAGRRVKCSACHHVWFQAAEITVAAIPDHDETPDIPPHPSAPGEPETSPQWADNARPTLQGAPTLAPDRPTPETDQPEIAVAQGDTEEAPGEAGEQTDAHEDGRSAEAESAADDAVRDDTASFEASRVAAADQSGADKHGRRGLVWLLLVIVVVAALAALYQWRGEVMQAVPEAIPAYMAAGLMTPPSSRNLTLEDVAFEVRDEDGDKVLIVSGLVVNAGPDMSQLPMLRAELLDGDGQVTTFWTFPATSRVLSPGEQTGFHDIYPDPPVTGHETDIFVTFEDLR